jgi:hypothetical protein
MVRACKLSHGRVEQVQVMQSKAGHVFKDSCADLGSARLKRVAYTRS